MLPDAVSHHLLSIAVKDRQPAFLTTDRQGCVVDFGGALSRYGLDSLTRGLPAAKQLFFLEGLLPLERDSVFLPFLKTGSGTPTDLHLFRNGDVDYSLFLDAEPGESTQQAFQQQLNDRALQQEIQARTSGADSSLIDLFEILQMVLLDRLSPNSFRVAGNPPGWFLQDFPVDDGSFRVPDNSFFLGNFLVDAEAFWLSGKRGCLKSGLWTEPAGDGSEKSFEAFAVRIADRPVLILGGPARNQEKKSTLQIARQRGLEVAAGARRERYLEDQLRQAQKMEAIGRLANGIAHDFSNILSVILAHSESILMFGESADKIKARAETIGKVVATANQLTGQLLSFSRKRSPSPRSIDVNGVIHGMERLVKGALGSATVAQYQLSPGISMIRLDSGQLEQVILNLAVNARDAMPTGGCLTIESGNTTLDASYTATREPVAPGKYVMLSVTDTGCGMDDKTLEMIFEPFFTTKATGTGLGLSTVYGIVRQNSGAIEVESEPGTGTTFRVYFPALEIEKSLAADLVRQP